MTKKNDNSTTLMRTVPSKRRARRAGIATAAVAALLLGACGDDNSDDAANRARDAAGQIDDAVDAGIARTQAEILRQRAKDLVRQGESLDSMSVLQEAARDLPRSPTVSGLNDGNGDGRDDDGKLQITIDESHSCVIVTGGDIDVTSNRC